MRTYFDEETDKKLLEAKSEDEVRSIIADTVAADKLADKIDLVMNELSRIKGDQDQEIDGNELDTVAGGSKLVEVYLNPVQGCMATFSLEDMAYGYNYCWSDDYCWVSNDYEYHNTRWSNCKRGGKHQWVQGMYDFDTHINVPGIPNTKSCAGNMCGKCGLKILLGRYNFDE